MFDEEPHEERCPEGLLRQCCKHEGHDGECDDFWTARAVMAETRIRELEATIERLRAVATPVLLMAAAHHRRRFDITCDHDEDCHCDAEARSTAALSDLREALTPSTKRSEHTADGRESGE